MREISLSSTGNTEIISITDKVAAAAANFGVKESICVVFAPHAMATVLMMEIGGEVEKDLLCSLSNIVPKGADYAYRHCSRSDRKVYVQVVGT